jgi:23S rRNA pseudouridine2605 synthase
MEPVPERDSRKVGLARALSKLGYCSRSRAADLIRTGHVQLNEKIRRDPETPTSLDKDRVSVDGQIVKSPEKIYVMMNKPRGLVTTTSDEKGRDTIYSIFENGPEKFPWLAPVGRLDKASEGLLLLTNDSEWGARIAAPETHLAKTYHVQIATVADENLLESLRSGIQTKHGDRLRATQATLLRAGDKNCWLEITLDEGKNRQIRRMFEALGVEVLRLIRVSIGPLNLGDLKKGGHRRLTAEEKGLLDRAMRAVASGDKAAQSMRR